MVVGGGTETVSSTVDRKSMNSQDPKNIESLERRLESLTRKVEQICASRTWKILTWLGGIGLLLAGRGPRSAQAEATPSDPPSAALPAANSDTQRDGSGAAPPPFGEVRFGSLRLVTPISTNWGLDRGLPIDRYYIESFFARHAGDVRGRVLELLDDEYTRRFGGDRVTQCDILNLETGVPGTTIVGDLTCAPQIPSDTFDCIIVTQTLQFIYDVRAAVQTLQRILKPGGVLLASFPGISQTYELTWGDSWFWNFTPVSAQRLFQEAFPATNVQVEAFGNVLTAISFLEGIAAEELRPEELDCRCPGYDVSIAVRCLKPAGEVRPKSAEDLR
jgi:SAM-dependent methyltransferase